MKTNSILNVPVSYFPNYISVEPKTVNLLSILTSQRHKDKIETIRTLTSKMERDALKAKLPAFTPSGIFEHRADTGLIKHSGLIQLDIDAKENNHISNYDQIKDQLSKIPEIAYCGLSVSGTGYWCLVPIAYPEKHREHFKAIEMQLKFLGLNIDKTCINVSRLRGISYDPDAYFNHEATEFIGVYQQKKEQKRTNFNSSTSSEAASINLLIQQIEKEGIDITDGYQAWFALGCSLANEFGESGREYFHRISQFSNSYTVSETDIQYNKCLEKSYEYSISTFYFYCKRFNVLLKEVS